MIGMLALILLTSAGSPANNVEVTFERDVRPIFEKRCQPCHFEGGSMHARLPFDKAATIHKLGPKLLTRIREDQERKIITLFLATRVE